MTAIADAISSAANPRFRAWRRLVEVPKSVKTGERTLIEGEHLIASALAVAVPMPAALVRGEVADLRPSTSALLETVASVGVPIYALAPTLYDKLAPVVRGNGIMVEIEVPRSQPLPTELDGDAVLLDGIQDPGNAGAMLRVAAAAGVRWALATSATTALWAPKVMRAGMGAHFQIGVIERVDIDIMCKAWPHATYYAADSGRGSTIWNATFPKEPVCWVWGGEGEGLSGATERWIGRGKILRVHIPMAAGIESLNVVSAAAVCLFERCRRTDAQLTRKT